MQGVVEFAGGVIQRADDVDALPRDAGIGLMRLSFGRPSTLDVGDRGEAAFIEIEQAEPSVPGGLLEALQVGLRGIEVLWITFFFNDNRVRLKENPLFFKFIARQS